jgi:hypothetical protein
MISVVLIMVVQVLGAIIVARSIHPRQRRNVKSDPPPNRRRSGTLRNVSMPMVGVAASASLVAGVLSSPAQAGPSPSPELYSLPTEGAPAAQTSQQTGGERSLNVVSYGRGRNELAIVKTTSAISGPFLPAGQWVSQQAPIGMADGTTKPIAKVEPGDRIVTTDLKTGRLDARKVVNVTAGITRRPLVPVEHGFTRGTPAHMADGTTKPIAKVKPGERVITINPKTGRTTTGKVTAAVSTVDRHRLTEITIDGQTLAMAGGHLVYNATKHRWVRVRSLESGDRLVMPTGRTTTIDDVHQRPAKPANLVNLTIDRFPAYYAGHLPVLVHNYTPPTTTLAAAPDPGGDGGFDAEQNHRDWHAAGRPDNWNPNQSDQNNNSSGQQNDTSDAEQNHRDWHAAGRPDNWNPSSDTSTAVRLNAEQIHKRITQQNHRDWHAAGRPDDGRLSTIDAGFRYKYDFGIGRHPRSADNPLLAYEGSNAPDAAWRELHRCFNCSFPIDGAPEHFPENNEYIPLRACAIDGIGCRDAHVRAYPKDAEREFKLVAQERHFDAPGSDVNFTFHNNADDELNLSVAANVIDSEIPEVVNKAFARNAWRNFARTLGNNMWEHQGCRNTCPAAASGSGTASEPATAASEPSSAAPATTGFDAVQNHRDWHAAGRPENWDPTTGTAGGASGMIPSALGEDEEVAIPGPDSPPLPEERQEELRARTERLLGETELGRAALAWVREHDELGARGDLYNVVYTEGTASHYDGLRRTIFIGADQSPEEVSNVYVHEVHHAQHPESPDPREMGRQQYIDAAIDEEVDGFVLQARANQQLEAATRRGAGREEFTRQVLLDLYDGDREKIENAVYEGEKIVSSGNHRPYPENYGKAWDSQQKWWCDYVPC